MPVLSGTPFILLCIAVCVGLIGPFVAFDPTITRVLVVVCLGLLAAAVWMWLFDKKRDRYDLGALRDLHDREAEGPVEAEEEDDYDSVMCLACNTVYSAHLPACPHCGKAL